MSNRVFLVGVLFASVSLFGCIKNSAFDNSCGSQCGNGLSLVHTWANFSNGYSSDFRQYLNGTPETLFYVDSGLRPSGWSCFDSTSFNLLKNENKTVVWFDAELRQPNFAYAAFDNLRTCYVHLKVSEVQN